jgi:hypothetical protein
VRVWAQDAVLDGTGSTSERQAGRGRGGRSEQDRGDRGGCAMSSAKVRELRTAFINYPRFYTRSVYTGDAVLQIWVLIWVPCRKKSPATTALGLLKATSTSSASPPLAASWQERWRHGDV